MLAASILIFAFLFIDYFENKKNIQKIQKSHANTIINTLNSDFQHTFEANTRLEELIVQHLKTSASLVEHIDNQKVPNISKIRKIAEENEISSVSFLDENGKLISTTESTIVSVTPDSTFFLELVQLKESEFQFFDLGNLASPYTKSNMYFMLMKRSQSDGFILIGLSNKKMIELRRNFGIGTKIEEFSKNPEIAYIVLQDEYGIYAASSNMVELKSLSQDEDLSEAIIKRDAIIRETSFNGEDILEVVKAIIVSDDNVMLSRVGLRQEKIKEIESKAFDRSLLIGIITFFAFVIVIVYVLTRQKLVNLGIEHQKIQSYVQVLLENVADGVIALDSERNIILFNQAAENSLEMKKSNVLGRKYSEVFEIDLFNINDAIEKQSSIIESSIKYTTPKSKVHYLTYTTNTAYNFDELESILIFIRNISEQVKIQKQMEIKEKQIAINQLASGIAHEIRNPLNAIFIIIQRFQIEFQTINENEAFQKLLVTIRKEIERINDIIEQFLDFSRPQNLSLERVNMSELMDEVISLIDNYAIARKIEIYKNYREFIFAEIDPKQMKQVMLNLTQNAFDAMPEGGDLVITILQEENELKIRITDNGIGISEELKNKIFSLYFTTKKNGHGLGLAIVHQIITEHNGEIHVQSNEGGGTTFEIVLQVNN